MKNNWALGLVYWFISSESPTFLAGEGKKTMKKDNWFSIKKKKKKKTEIGRTKNTKRYLKKQEFDNLHSLRTTNAINLFPAGIELHRAATVHRKTKLMSACVPTWLTVAPMDPCNTIWSILASGGSCCTAFTRSFVLTSISSIATSIGLRTICNTTSSCCFIFLRFFFFFFFVFRLLSGVHSTLVNWFDKTKPSSSDVATQFLETLSSSVETKCDNPGHEWTEQERNWPVLGAQR